MQEPTTVKRKFEVRPYQERINARVRINWDKGLTSQMIVSPTGSGKSVMALRAARHFVLDYAPKTYGVTPMKWAFAGWRCAGIF